MTEDGHLVPPAWILQNQAAWIRQSNRQLLRSLPRRVRLRLAVTRRIDGAAIWLCEHVSWRAAQALWFITGHW